MTKQSQYFHSWIERYSKCIYTSTWNTQTISVMVVSFVLREWTVMRRARTKKWSRFARRLFYRSDAKLTVSACIYVNQNGQSFSIYSIFIYLCPICVVLCYSSVSYYSLFRIYTSLFLWLLFFLAMYTYRILAIV